MEGLGGFGGPGFLSCLLLASCCWMAPFKTPVLGELTLGVALDEAAAAAAAKLFIIAMVAPTLER